MAKKIETKKEQKRICYVVKDKKTGADLMRVENDNEQKCLSSIQSMEFPVEVVIEKLQ
jgi:hypothetical protein